MKKFTILFISILSTICVAAGSLSNGTPTTMNTRNTASTALDIVFTGTNAALLSNLQGVSHWGAYNGTTTPVAIGVRTNTCGASTTDNFIIPASSGIVIDNVAIGKAICARSTAATSVVSGKIFTFAW